MNMGHSVNLTFVIPYVRDNSSWLVTPCSLPVALQRAIDDDADLDDAGREVLRQVSPAEVHQREAGGQ